MTSKRGAYFLANDAVLDWTLAMVSSFRRHDRETPLTWIPFGGKDNRLQQSTRRYGVERWDDTSTLVKWDAIGTSLYPDNPVGARLFRKMAAFDGPYDTFAFVDSDVILNRSLRWAFEAFGTSGVDVAFYDEGLEDVYAGAELQRRMVDGYGARGWNTGFWLGRGGAITMDAATRAMASAQKEAHGFAATGEQPFFNYLLDTGRTPTASLRSGATSSLSPSLIVDRDDFVRTAAPAIHWAGRGRPSFFMPHAITWLSYRLAAPRRLTMVDTLLARPLGRRLRGIAIRTGAK
jgi:hypothetical protein